MSSQLYQKFSTFFFICLILLACQSKKIIPTAPVVAEILVPKGDPAVSFAQNVTQKSWLPEWFSAKAKIAVVSNGSSIDFDAVVQFRKDSAILLVGKKFGFEVGRALITPDSFFLINRLQQEYEAKPLSAIANRLNLPPQFSLIQHLIMGNPVNLNVGNYQVNMKDSLAVLSSQYQSLEADCFVDKKQFTLYQSDFEDASVMTKLTMRYGGFKPLSNQQNFSYTREILGNSKQMGSLDADMQFTDVEINKVKILRFEIPPRYKKVQ